MTLLVMTREFELAGEIALFSSLEMSLSYYGIGEMHMQLALNTPCGETLLPGRILFDPQRPKEAYLIESRCEEGDSLRIDGVELKGDVKKRICVPPLTLPDSLYRYDGGWREITDAAQIEALLKEDVYEGYAFPEPPLMGMVFLNMSGLACAYSWDKAAQTGQTWLDLGMAQKRSKYKNFGYDSIIAPGETAMRHFVRGNLIAAEDALRNIEGYILAEDEGRGQTLPWRARFDKLEDMLKKIGEMTGIGYRVRPDFEKKQFVFEVFEGRNLTEGTERVVISKEMGNAAQPALKSSFLGTCTTCYAGGAGENEQRLILSVGNEISGADRREMFTDAGAAHDAETLKWAAQRKLEGVLYSKSLTARVLDSGACRFQRDWNVGDKVVLQYGQTQLNTRVLSVTRVIECEKPVQLEAVFESAAVTLADALKRAEPAAIR